MPKFIIERNIAGAGKLSADELQGIALTSCQVIKGMAPNVQWMESFITADKWYCIFIAPTADLVRQHATRSGFAADAVNKVFAVIDPVCAEIVMMA